MEICTWSVPAWHSCCRARDATDLFPWRCLCPDKRTEQCQGSGVTGRCQHSSWGQLHPVDVCVLDPLCLQLHLFYTYFTPTSLITHHLLVVWQVAVYIPEVKPHFQGASTIYSILKPGFTGMAHHLQSPALWSPSRQSRQTGKNDFHSGICLSKRDSQAVKSQAP